MPKVIKSFKFNYLGYEIRVTRVNLTGIYGDFKVWHFEYNSANELNEFLSKVQATKDTLVWAKLKAISLVNEVIKEKKEDEFNYYNYFDGQAEQEQTLRDLDKLNEELQREEAKNDDVEY
jgi:hypothetical protein